MKKLFLIPLMTLMTCVFAWGETAEVNTLDGLKTALENSNYDVIKLTADLTYTNEACINILRSVTIDGQGHKINGGGIRTGSTKSTMAINQGAPDNENWIDLVTLKNLTLQNAISAGQALNVRCNLTKLVIENCTIQTTGSGNNQPITFGGNQEEPVDLTINNSYISSGQAGYPLITFNPIALKTKNTTYKGYCALYFKGVNSSAGSGGSSVDADACDFDAPNMNEPAGGWNSFGTFAIADGGITFNLNNCGFNSQEIGSDQQQVFLFKYEGAIASIDPCVVHITGDNSHVNGDMLRDAQKSARDYFKENYDPNAWNHVLEITGGTYAQDPATMTSGDLAFVVPSTHEVIQVTLEGVATPLYRVVKKAASYIDPATEEVVLYDLNDAVETAAEGENPVTSFELSSGEVMKLDSTREVTTAGYVQVTDDDEGNATTIVVGSTDLEKDSAINQTLVINNGLDVQGESQVIVQAGSTVQIGEGGINTEKPSNIVIEADENGAASLIMDPAITVNQTPNLTVKMKAKQIGWINLPGNDTKYRFWHRFALPIQEADSWVKIPNKSTYVFGWNYTANDWEQLSALTQMEPFKGYTLTADYENLGDVEYTFTGQLAGNTNNALNFERNGFNFFGNSYTGYIDILALVDQIMGDNKIDGTVWMWYQDNQSYVAVPLQALRDNPSDFDSWMREVAPMQTFILKQNGSENATAELNYASAVWGNPRYGNAPAGAPARANAADETTRMRIIVTADNGKSDFVTFTEADRFSDEFEKGYDGVKYMNESTINMYATIDGEDYSYVATDNLIGKKLSIQTVNALNYSISFAKVSGEEYALRDNVTGQVVAIEDGATYPFSAQPDATIAGRFEIVGRNMVVTGVENVENNADVKGIYTVLGQYVGEDFNALPAGMYIVNGVKIVK